MRLLPDGSNHCLIAINGWQAYALLKELEQQPELKELPALLLGIRLSQVSTVVW